MLKYSERRLETGPDDNIDSIWIELSLLGALLYVRVACSMYGCLLCVHIYMCVYVRLYTGLFLELSSELIFLFDFFCSDVTATRLSCSDVILDETPTFMIRTCLGHCISSNIRICRHRIQKTLSIRKQRT